jgi:iron(III) transport system substrate-binding protein
MRSVVGAFTADTGISVVLTTENGPQLTDKLIAEKHTSTADLVLADGIGYLWRTAENDLLRPSNSAQLESNIPDDLRDAENLWFGLLVSARTIAYDKRVVDPGQLTGYAALGDARYGASVCLSSAADVDNQSLIAMMIAEHGDRPTELIVRSWVANLAMPPLAGDAELLQEIEEGRCKLGIVNSDDVARLVRDNADTPVALYWPPTPGAYINVVGAAITRHAGNPAGALRLLEWLSSDKGSKVLGGQMLGYPANAKLPIEHISPIRLARAGYFHEDALKLMERAHWVDSE